MLNKTMGKITFLKCCAVLAALFFAANGQFISAFDFQEVCQPPLKTFLNGESSTGYQTIDVIFPPGGGVTCFTAEPCPLISIPAEATIYSVTLDIELTDPDVEIKTPYIWIPMTYFPDGVTGNNRLKQISTADCSLIETYNVTPTPSRTYVIPGGDVWVASLEGTDVTKLSPLRGRGPVEGYCGDLVCGLDEDLYYCPDDCSGNICGSTGTEDCRKYEVVGTFTVATNPGVKGLTGTPDMTGATTGFVWTGNCADRDVATLNYDGVRTSPDVSTGGCPFGAVADYFDHIWISNPGNAFLQCINISNRALRNVATIDLPYGIDVDEDSNVYATCFECGTTNGYDPTPLGNCSALPIANIYDTYVHYGPRGVAVDQKGYVWTANSHDDELYTFINPSTWYNVHPGTKDLNGVAIDYDGYGWVVSYDAGIAYKYEFDDVNNMFDLQCQTPYLEGKPDAYSGMTGLRANRKSITIDGILRNDDVSGTGTFVICAEDETMECEDSAPCAAVTALLDGCVPDEIGNCSIPLEVFSNQGGLYTLTNLEVKYGLPVPVTTGGLVPCGRNWDDPDTAWDERDSCQICHFIVLASRVINFMMGLVALLAVLVMIIAGLIYVKTSGDASLILSAKQNVNKILQGFIIIFVAWALVNLAMVLFGFTDPLGDGSWAIFDCTL